MSDTRRTRVALVTGGGGGIGSAICRRLAASGMVVAMTYAHHAERANGLARELPGKGHFALRVPVEDAAAQRTLAAELSDRFGRLDVLVNNAGITEPVPHHDLERLTDELIDAILRTNVRGLLATIRSMKPLLDRGVNPVIVNISSISARSAQGSNVAYCASKAAVDNITMSLARAFAPSIRVVGVAPGWVIGEYASRMPAELLNAQRELTPLGRLAEAGDVANAVAAIVNDLTFTTGVTIPVDGGRQLS